MSLSPSDSLCLVTKTTLLPRKKRKEKASFVYLFPQWKEKRETLAMQNGDNDNKVESHYFLLNISCCFYAAYSSTKNFCVRSHFAT